MMKKKNPEEKNSKETASHETASQETAANKATTQKLISETIKILVDQVKLEGELIIPPNAQGIVLFAHGSGSSRFSPRNQFVARVLQQHGMATLLIDLLTREEEEIDQITRAIRFNIDLLADRLIGITDWILEDTRTQSFKIGCFGSSTGAAAALIAAAKKGKFISAVVSRGGRPDLAQSFLGKVQAPTLLIVGGADAGVIELNQEAYDRMTCQKKIDIVPHATHLFEEKGALEKVAELAADWFLRYLV